MGPGSTRFSRLSLRQLELLAIGAPLVFLAGVYLLVLGPVHPMFHNWPGLALLALVFTVAVWLFSRSVFGAFRSLQGEVETLSALTERYNQQLVSLHGADLLLTRETRVDDALLRIAELGANLTGACHAMLVTRESSGAARVFAYPAGGPAGAPRCAVETAMRDGVAVDAMTADADSLLIVPLAHLGTPVGTLCLGRAYETAAPFAPVDERIASMFATHAALVVQNDRLYEEIRTLAIEAERQALAREMHDSLAQVLAFVNAKAQAVEQYLRNADVAAARQQMAELSAAAREVYADIREGIAALRVDVAGKTLHQLIDESAAQFNESTGLRVRVDWSAGGTELELPPAAEVQLLRIMQEALANARRHSGAETVDITVSTARGRLRLVVADNGRGFDTGDRTHDGRPRFGLQTMAERAQAIGGELTVESATGTGTRISTTVPVTVRAPVAGEA